MRQKLRFKIDDETGMCLGLVALVIVVVGGVLAFTVLPSGGYWIGLFGALLGLLGAVIHFVTNWRSIFRIDR